MENFVQNVQIGAKLHYAHGEISSKTVKNKSDFIQKKFFVIFFAKSPYSHDQIMSKNNICAQNHPIMMVKFCQNCKKK